MSIEFKPWPKIPRLYRNIVVTEKIDGTNAAVGIARLSSIAPVAIEATCAFVKFNDEPYIVYAQSRKRIITPNDDNYSFAAWVRNNAEGLVEMLGEGLHFGEWWGSGIGRRYGMTDKHFSLFNVNRYADVDLSLVPNVHLVPVLFRGAFTTTNVDYALAKLAHTGSVAAPGFMDPEGIIVFHEASGEVFKVTVKNDEKPKGSNEPG